MTNLLLFSLCPLIPRDSTILQGALQLLHQLCIDLRRCLLTAHGDALPPLLFHLFGHSLLTISLVRKGIFGRLRLLPELRVHKIPVHVGLGEFRPNQVAQPHSAEQQDQRTQKHQGVLKGFPTFKCKCTSISTSTHARKDVLRSSQVFLSFKFTHTSQWAHKHTQVRVYTRTITTYTHTYMHTYTHNTHTRREKTWTHTRQTKLVLQRVPTIVSMRWWRFFVLQVTREKYPKTHFSSSAAVTNL